MKITDNYYTPIQLKLPVDFGKIIDITDPVYTFMEVMNRIDLKRYIVEKDYITGRPGYDSEKLLKITLFAFMENGYVSLREIEKLCKTDIRFMWILDDMKVPSYVSIGNFINNSLKFSVEEIFSEIHISFRLLELTLIIYILMVLKSKLMPTNTHGYGKNHVLKAETRHF